MWHVSSFLQPPAQARPCPKCLTLSRGPPALSRRDCATQLLVYANAVYALGLTDGWVPRRTGDARRAHSRGMDRALCISAPATAGKRDMIDATPPPAVIQ